MNRSVRRFLFATSTVAVAGCASTSMTSMAAPELRGRSFHGILAFADIADLGLKIAMETRMATGVVSFGAPALPGVRFVPSHTVFFPGRDYSREQVVEIMRQNGIDATLVITPGATGSTEGFVPPSYNTRCTAFSMTGGCTQITTTPSGGFSYSKPWAQFAARLYDAADGQVVWVSTATASGNAFAQSADLVQSMADETLAHLYRDKIIQADCASVLSATADSMLGPGLQRSARALQDSIAQVRDSLPRLPRELVVPASATASERAYADSVNAPVRRVRAQLESAGSRLAGELVETQAAISHNDQRLDQRKAFCQRPANGAAAP